MAEMASPRSIIDFYANKNGPAIPRGNGLRPVGPTPASVFPVTPYQAPPAIIEVAPTATPRVLPAGEPIQMGGRAPVPSLRAAAGFPAGNPLPVEAAKRIGYTPRPEPMRTLPNARGLKATTVFGRGAAAPAAAPVAAPTSTAYKAGTAFAKGAAKIGAKIGSIGLRSALRGAGGAVLTDMIFPREAGGFDDAAAIKNWAPPVNPRNNEAAFRASQEGAYTIPTAAPQPRPSIRRADKTAPRVAAPEVMLQPANDPPPDRIAAPPAVQVAQPLITEMTDAAGALPTSVAAGVPITGDNGGFAFTGDKGGNVERMFYLRQRTAAEDAARPVETQPAAPAAVKDMSPGSQGAWEAEQAATPDGNPFFFKRQALMLEQRKQAEAEAAGLGLRTTTQAKTDADVANTLSTTRERNSLLRGKVAAQGAELTKTGMESLKLANDVESENELRPYDIAVKGGLAGSYRANTAATLAETPARIAEANARTALLGKQTETMPDRAQIAAEKNAAALALQEEKNAMARERLDAPIYEAAIPIAAKTGTPVADVVKYQKMGATYRKARLLPGGVPKDGWYVGDKQVTASAAAPAGMTLAGTTPDGRPVYTDGKQKFVGK